MTKEILLTRGFVTLVDDGDYEWLNSYKWHYLFGYARRNMPTSPGKQHAEFMHRWVLDLAWGDPRVGDHINHDSLDNRRENLRICTMAGNARNASLRTDNSSRFKGVSWHKRVSWASSLACVIFHKQPIPGISGRSSVPGFSYDTAQRYCVVSTISGPF